MGAFGRKRWREVCPPGCPSATDDRPVSDRVSKLTQPVGNSVPAHHPAVYPGRCGVGRRKSEGEQLKRNPELAVDY